MATLKRATREKMSWLRTVEPSANRSEIDVGVRSSSAARMRTHDGNGLNFLAYLGLGRLIHSFVSAEDHLIMQVQLTRLPAVTLATAANKQI